jgi:hypothetical protein
LDQEQRVRCGIVEGDCRREPFRETEDLREGVTDSDGDQVVDECPCYETLDLRTRERDC